MSNTFKFSFFKPPVNAKYLAILALVMGALAGCSKPTDTVIPSDMSSWDKALTPALKKLSDSDRKKVTDYLLRHKMGQALGGAGIPLGTTVGDAIADENKWEAAQAAKEAALKKKLELQQAAAINKLNKALTVTLLSKTENPADPDNGEYSQYEEFKVGIQNNTKKTMIGESGEIDFINVFGKNVGEVTFSASENIRPGKSITWTGERDYNSFIDSQKAVWNLEVGKYTTRFVPNMVVFKDGTRLSVPQ